MKHNLLRHINALLIAVLLVAAFSSITPIVPARAAITITVNTLNDDMNNDGLCTLREAITVIRGLLAGDTVDSDIRGAAPRHAPATA